MVANESTRLLNVAQAARLLRCSTDTVRRRIRDGSLEAYRIGHAGGFRIPERSVDGLLVRVERKGQT